MRHEQSHSRLWIFGSIALGVVVLAFAFSTVFTSADATATSNEARADAASADSTSAQHAPAKSPQTRSSHSVDPVKVTVTDDTLSAPGTVSADSATFRVVNKGPGTHGFAIGPAIQAEAVARLDGPLETGQSKVLTTELQPGTYIAYCPVEDHQARERTTVSVERVRDNR